MQQKTFLRYIHYFRGLAILLIVGLHVCIAFHWGENFVQRRVAVALVNNGTVLFVFIAGFLFYHLNKDKFNYGDYLKKKFLYVIVPYMLVSIPALIDKFYFDKVGDHWWMNHGFAEKSPILQVLYLLGTGRHMGVFWFIPMITVLYVAAPLILAFARTKAFMYVIPVIAIAGLFTFRFGYYANIFLSLMYFVPVYLFGIWSYKIKDFLLDNAKSFVIVCGTIFVSMTLLEIFELIPFSEQLALRDVKYSVYAFNFNKAKMTIFGVGVLLLFFLFNHKKIKAFQLLGDYSFGIFFVHLYVIQIFRLLDKSGHFRISPINFFTFIVWFAIVMALTVLIVKLVKIVFKEKSRYVIGS